MHAMVITRSEGSTQCFTCNLKTQALKVVSLCGLRLGQPFGQPLFRKTPKSL